MPRRREPGHVGRPGPRGDAPDQLDHAGPPAPPWEHRRPQRQRLLSRESIVAAALTIIDLDGTDAVTMRRVAGDLGVTASSLYVHVRNRDELIRLALHEVLEQSGAIADTGDWQADLSSYFLGLRAQLAAHGDLARYAFADTPTPGGEHDLRELEDLLERLMSAGIPAEVAVGAFDRLLLYTVADVYEAWCFAQKEGDQTTAAWIDSMRDYVRGLPRASYPRLTEHADVLLDPSPGPRFRLGLELLLDGIAAQAARASRAGGSGRSADR